MTTMKRRLLTGLLVACAACGGGGEGEPPSTETGQGAPADSAQKDNTGPAGAHTGG